jgi:hypothetical protein
LLFDERYLFRATPVFELLLSGNSGLNVAEVLIPDKDAAVVTLGEGRALGVAVLPDATLEVVGYSNV